MTAYRVTARRAGDWWALEVHDLPGVFSQTKRLDRADAQAREAIAVMLDVDPDSIEVAVEPELPEAAQAALREAEKAREVAAKAAEAERQAMQRAASVLTRDLSQRDAGRVMGLSFQRVSQLLQPLPTPRSKANRPGRKRGRTNASA